VKDDYWDWIGTIVKVFPKWEDRAHNNNNNTRCIYTHREGIIYAERKD